MRHNKADQYTHVRVPERKQRKVQKDYWEK